jgi:glycosyltransferase involved in cell wall biosynthesis
MNKYEFRKTIYNIYKKCKYIISLIPIENDYLFKKWGINSILLDNPTTFKYDFVIPSDLSKKNIIMIGRADDPIKRYDLGIKAMTSILKEIPDSQMNILSKINEDYQKLIENLSLEKNVRFVDYQQNITLFLKKSSLHLLTSLAESYSMVLSETKIFGIPSIICGLDYLALSKEGTIIIYDDNPDTIAKEAITILKDDKYRQRLGLQARNSMKKHQNNLITKKWVKLLFAVYKGDIESYKELQESSNKISEIEVENILNNQLNLLKKRIPQFREITLEQLKAYLLPNIFINK